MSESNMMESIISAYISQELVSKPEMLPLRNDESLIESRILDSLSLLKLVLFLEEKFRVVVSPEEIIPQNFATIQSICSLLRAKQKK